MEVGQTYLVRLWDVRPRLIADRVVMPGQLVTLAQIPHPVRGRQVLAVKTFSTDTIIGYIPDRWKGQLTRLMRQYIAHVTMPNNKVLTRYNDRGYCNVRILFIPRTTPVPKAEAATRLPYAD